VHDVFLKNLGGIPDLDIEHKAPAVYGFCKSSPDMDRAAIFGI